MQSGQLATPAMSNVHAPHGLGQLRPKGAISLRPLAAAKGRRGAGAVRRRQIRGVPALARRQQEGGGPRAAGRVACAALAGPRVAVRDDRPAAALQTPDCAAQTELVQYIHDRLVPLWTSRVRM